MDLNDLTPDNNSTDSKLELTGESIGYLNETWKWTIFLAIMGFIFLGLMIVASFSFGAIFSTFGGQAGFPGFLIVIYLIMAVIYFFPILYLYRFASFTKKGLQERNTHYLADGFSNLKSHYKYIGILTIIMLGFYLLFFTVGGLFRIFM